MDTEASLIDFPFLPPDSGLPAFIQLEGGRINATDVWTRYSADQKGDSEETQDMIFNFSLNVAYDIIRKSQKTKILFPETEVILIIIYTVLIASGIISNLLVCFVVIRQCFRKKMDLGSSGPKLRNLYVVNLAVADLALCCICMPFTLITLIQYEWTFGSLLCKMVPMVQGTNIMVSAGTITAIAFDRYITIVRPPGSRVLHNHACCNVIVVIGLIWIFSFAVTSPVFFYTVVEPVTFYKFLLYEKCIERWPSNVLYTMFTVAFALFQFVIPGLVLITIHLKISAYLKTHLKPINKSKPKIEIHSPMEKKEEDRQQDCDDGRKEDSSKKELLGIRRNESIGSDNSQRSYDSLRKSSDCSRKFSDSSRKNSDSCETKRGSCDMSPRKKSDFLATFREGSDFSGFSFHRFSEKSRSGKNHKKVRREIRRNRRTMYLLSCIAIIYAVSWLPMTIFQIVTTQIFLFDQNPKTVYAFFTACHILAMSTAITNPFLYGWLNTNFRREFTVIFSSVSVFFFRFFKIKFDGSIKGDGHNISNNNNINNNNNNNNNINDVENQKLRPEGNQAVDKIHANGSLCRGGRLPGGRRASLTCLNGKPNSTAVTIVASTTNVQL